MRQPHAHHASGSCTHSGATHQRPVSLRACVGRASESTASKKAKSSHAAAAAAEPQPRSRKRKIEDADRRSWLKSVPRVCIQLEQWLTPHALLTFFRLCPCI